MRKLILVCGVVLAIVGATLFLQPNLGSIPLGGGKRPLLDPALAQVPPDRLKDLNLIKQTDHMVDEAESTSVARLEGGVAPAFELLGTDGKRWTLAELTKDKPLLVYFIERECPCCVGAKPFLERVRVPYEEVLNTVAIINCEQAPADKWAKAVTALFPVLVDPETKVIDAYKAERGAYTMLVSKSAGRIVKAFPGYSAEMLKELGRAVAKEAGVQERPIDTSGAPEKMVSGCLFPDKKPAPKS